MSETELREQVARWLFGLNNPDRYWDAEWVDRAPIYAEVDASPLAPLLAKLRAVEALAGELDREGVVMLFHGPHNRNQFITARIRRALDAES